MRSRWVDSKAEKLKGLDLLVYITRLIGQDTELVLWGGGNSSMKMSHLDHLGREVRVMWIKGSGSDMRTITARQFTPLRLDELLVLWNRESMSDEEMVAFQSQCVLEMGSPKPSIETLLHAFIPATHVYHTHADSICALTDVSDSEHLIRTVFGKEVGLIPYRRPGFDLAKLVGEACLREPTLCAIILNKHGLVTWGENPKEAYLKTIGMVQQAQQFIKENGKKGNHWRVNRPSIPSSRARHSRASKIVVMLRSAISQTERKLLLYDDSGEVLHFLKNSRAQELCRIGPFTPDHILHTKARPLFIDLPDLNCTDEVMNQEVQKAVDRYRQEYIRYFEHFKTPGMKMQDPFPRIILIPGIGMFTCGKDRRACEIAHDIYLHTMRVLVNASSIGTYSSISPKDLFDFEYWPLETYKLTLRPPEKELSRRIALVTGGAGAIGSEVARRLLKAGASVILSDVNERKLRTLTAELNEEFGEQNAFALRMDVTNETSVKNAFRKAVLAYGGLDLLVSNAGVAHSDPVDSLSLMDWKKDLEVNATGHFLISREAMRVFKRQGLGGNIVVVSTKNVLVPGKEFGAYSASKAAQAQLTRVLAIEGGNYGVRVNMVNPDAVLKGSGIWSRKIRASRAKAYGIRVEELENYCVTRNLLKVEIQARDVAEAVLFLATDQSSKTTGAMIPVDGGVREAFPR